MVAARVQKKDDFDQQLQRSVKKMQKTYVPSETVVMEAAFYLIKEGILKTPDIGIVNVKQARALLWNAAWLQEHMNSIWRDQGVLPKLAQQSKTTLLDDFSLAIMGLGGTGKAAVLKTIDALIEFFVGAASVHRLAPSNAAARLLGGDTLHAVCKLPFGKNRLNSKKGRLAKATLRRHQKKWKNIGCLLR